MDMKAMLEKAHADTMHHTSLMLAAQELESATYAARQAREKLRRTTRNRLQAKGRHGDAHLRWLEEEPGTAGSESAWVRVDVARWALENAERDEHDALNDYRDALKRLEVLGATVGEADSHDVPSFVRHRARKAIAVADAFGNKVTMDGTLYEGLHRPVLPELSPKVEVQEFRVIDPLEPVEAWTQPEPRAVLVPVEDYERPDAAGHMDGDQWIPAEDLPSSEDPDDDGARENEPEHMSPEWWKRVTFSAPLNVKDPLPATNEDGEKALEGARLPDPHATAVCPECRVKKCSSCDGSAWDDAKDRPTGCSCEAAGHEVQR